MKMRPFKKAISSIAKDVSRESNASAFRLYKAVVTEAPDAVSHIGKIRFVGESSQISLPFVNNTKSSVVGDIVWVGTVFDSLRNAVVWAKKDLSVWDGSGSSDDSSELNTALEDRLDGIT